MATVKLDLRSIDDYRTFLKIKSLPAWSMRGRVATFPDEYISQVGAGDAAATTVMNYTPKEFLFDYQRDISALSIRKRKFAVFADCGLGKTLMLAEFARAAYESLGTKKGVLVVSPLMVIPQTVAEITRFYGDSLPIEVVPSGEAAGWIGGCGGKVGITNFEAFNNPHLRQGQLGALIVDESSMLKSHYGKWGTAIIELGRGLEWKWAGTGTPAPNDRIEYANHAVFLDRMPTVNSFLATYFVNRGQTDNRWELKPHALKPFYRALSDWCIFLSNPGTYGWRDNCDTIPPIHTSIEPVSLSDQQRDAVRKETGQLVVSRLGGIGQRSVLGQIGKGNYRGNRIETMKPQYIRDSVAKWQGNESTIIWCCYDDEQEQVASAFNGDAISLSGKTKMQDRINAIEAFKAGDVRTLISKPKILGFGLNLQIATRQVFSGLQDSYESYYQAVKRSNRVGSTKPLNVHIPVTEIEEPMVQTVLNKADRVDADTRVQEQLFHKHSKVM